MLFAIDVETECTVAGCPHVGQALCAAGHSLSPWHSRVTVAAVVSDEGPWATSNVFRGNDIGAQLTEFFSQWPEWTVTGQNFKFDWLHLARHGFEIPLDKWVGDSQLAAYTLTDKIPDGWLAQYDEKRSALGGHHRKAGKHSLKTLAPYFLGVEPFWEPADGNLDSDEYVLKDAEYTLRLTKHLENALRERDQLSFYQDKLLPWTKMLLEAEWRGVALDMDGLLAKEQELTQLAVTQKAQLDTLWAPAYQAFAAKLRSEVLERYAAGARAALAKPVKKAAPDRAEKIEARYEKLATAALERLDTQLNLASSTQMTWLLRDFHGYPITSLDGDESTGREVLERLANEGHHDVEVYLEWRKTNKILTAFLPTYKELAVREGGGHVLHPIYNVTSTKTGRTSSERPNAQQFPPKLRPLIRARPGYTFIGYDAAAIEAKLIALYTQDPTLYEIVNSGVSIHDHNTKIFFGLGDDVTYAQVKKNYPEHRSASKNVGFALFYNAGVNRIRIAFAQKGFHLSEAECRKLLQRFRESYKAAVAYSKDVVEYMEQGNVLPNLLGRPLAMENAEDAYMQAFNKLIQSSASDLNLEGARRALAQIRAAGIEAHPALFVHDFVALEVPLAQAEQANEILANVLVDFDLQTEHGPIRLEVEGGIMERWEK